MEDQVLKSLRDEYSKLFSLIEKNFTMPYNVLPLAAAVVAAMAFLGTGIKDGNTGIAEIVICYGIAVVAIWQSFVHVSICTVGKRLVELENLINTKVGADDNQGLKFFTSTMGSGYKRWIGLKLTTATAFATGLLIEISATLLAWPKISDLVPKNDTLAQASAFLLTFLPIVIVITMCVNILKVEKEFGIKKAGNTTKEE